jgi:hypothetical protein
MRRTFRNEQPVTIERKGVAHNNLDKYPWNTVDGPALVATAAGLQLIPENIDRLLQLQRLAAIGLALPPLPNAPSLSPSKVRSLLKDPLVSGPQIQSQEDPYDQLYTAEVTFHGGPNLVMQGLITSSAHVANLMLQAIAAAGPGTFSEEFISTVADLAGALLKISDQICRSAGLERGLKPSRPKSNAVFVPGKERLDALRQIVTFNFEKLGHLLPGSLIPIVRHLSTTTGNHKMNLGTLTDDGIVTRPFLAVGNGLIVASPSELASTLRHQIVLFAQQYGCVNELAMSLRSGVFEEASLLLEMAGAHSLDEEEQMDEPTLISRMFCIEEDIYLHLLIVSDDLSNYSEEDPSAGWSLEDLSKKVQGIVDSPDQYQRNEGETLTLVVIQSIGRFATFGHNSSGSAGPVLVLQLDELQVILEIDGDDPLVLWRFAQAVSKLHLTTKVLTFSALDTYALYRGHENSFYLGDEKDASFLVVPIGDGLHLRMQAQLRYDNHFALSSKRESYSKVSAIHGINISPIYATHPTAPKHELLVESRGIAVWIESPQLRNTSLQVLAGHVMEATAYWIWQIIIGVPKLVTNALDAWGQLRVVVSLCDEDQWELLLNGGKVEKSKSRMVNAHSATSGQLNVGIHPNGSHLLLSQNNDVDRQLVESLLRLLVELSGSNSWDIGKMVNELAPLGNKKMLHGFSDGNVSRRPGKLASARFLQPAISAIVMDELARWLETQGFQVGPIAQDERVEMLKLVVKRYYESLAAMISTLSTDGLLSKLMAMDESLVFHASRSEATMKSQVACFGEGGDHAKKLLKNHLSLVETSVASRFLIEYVAACPPNGERELSLDFYDQLLAVAAEIISRATLSDAIHQGFSDCNLSILESRRLGVSTKDSYAIGVRGFAAAYAESMRRELLDPRTTNQISTDTFNGPEIRVEEAMLAEFGFTLKELLQGMNQLILLGDQNCSSEPYEISEEQVRENFRIDLNWSKAKTDAFIEKLSLRKRTNFLEFGKDAYPWRYNREWSYARRPLVTVVNGQGAKTLVWGVRRLWMSGIYWFELIYSGKLRAQSKEMKALLGGIRQGANDAFEESVKQVLKKSGFSITAKRLSKIAGKRLLSSVGEDLGDIDVLGICPERKVICLAEAKDLELARTPVELANEVNSLLRDERSAKTRILPRVEWVERNLSLVLEHFKVDQNATGWRILPVIVTSQDLVTSRLFSEDISIICIDALPEWAAFELAVSKSNKRLKR